MKKLIFFLIIFISKTHPIIEVPLHEAETFLKECTKYLNENPIVIDAGAYNGKKEIPLIKKYFPKAQIHCFEPIPSIFELLKKTASNFTDVFCYKLALGEKKQTKEFFVSKLADKKNDKPYESSSLLPPKEHLNYAPYVLFDEMIQVDVLTLDEWALINNITKVDFLWLDLQGYELNVLKNASNTLKNVRIIYTEVEFVEAYKGQALYTELKNFLENKGFELIGRDFEEKPKHWFGNALFLKNSLL